jgi:hypothetical protein
MNDTYSQIEWHYRGPFQNMPYDDDKPNGAMAAAGVAEQEAMCILGLAGLRWKHAYSWPDGSLYHYVQWDAEKQDLDMVLNETMSRIQLRQITGFKLYPSDPKEDPHKADCKTLEEYFKL